MLNVFVLDDYDAYGELPIPGTATLHLPAGDATVSFHSQIIGSTSGGGLPIPDLCDDHPAERSRQAPAHRRRRSQHHCQQRCAPPVWVAHIPETGDYVVTTEGKVSAFISPRLSFGHGGQFGFLPWVFAGLFVASLLALLAAKLIPRRTREVCLPVSRPTRRASRRVRATDEGLRIQRLKTLTSLHESGALTDEEFEAEKRRVLGQ